MIKCSNIIPNTENYRERVDKVEDSTCVQARRGGGEVREMAGCQDTNGTNGLEQRPQTLFCDGKALVCFKQGSDRL